MLYRVRAQRPDLRQRSTDLDLEVYSVARVVAGDDQSSDSFSVLGMFPDGPRNHCQSDCVGLRSSMGSLGGNNGVGSVVD